MKPLKGLHKGPHNKYHKNRKRSLSQFSWMFFLRLHHLLFFNLWFAIPYIQDHAFSKHQSFIPFLTVRLNNCLSVRMSVCLSLFLACPQTNHFRGLPSAALWEMQATVKQSMSSLHSRDPDPDPRSWSSSFIGRFGAKIFSCVWFCPKTTRIFRVFYPQILSVIV